MSVLLCDRFNKSHLHRSTFVRILELAMTRFPDADVLGSCCLGLAAITGDSKDCDGW